MFAASKTSAAAAGAPPASTDPQFNYVTLLLNDTGTNGQQNNTFLDSSTNNFTITRNGTPTQGSVTPYWPDGQWSNYFNGSTDYLSYPDSAAVRFGVDNFTLECWFYRPSVVAANANIFWLNGNNNSSSYAGIRLALQSSGVISINASENGSSWQIGADSTTTVVLNTWNHVAVVRNGQTITAYLNGVSVVSANLSSSSASLYAGTLNWIGNLQYGGNYKYNGYLSNLRVVKGTAVYTSSFTPSTTPLTAISGTILLTCQSNRFKDNSSNNFAITVTGTPTVQAFDPFSPAASYGVSNGGSYLGATGNYLSFTGTNTAFEFGTGAWTVECWVYATTLNADQYVWDFRPSSNGAYPALDMSNVFKYVANAAVVITGTTAVKAGTWYHVAVCRSGTSTRLFVNGVQEGSTYTDSTNYIVASNRPYIGVDSFSSSSFPFIGYISNLRMVKGTAVYTSAFTPPTSPVTAITGTSLLLNFTNAGIYDAAVQNDLVTVGNAQVSTAVAKFGSSSMKFDGSGDWLTAPANALFNFGTGNFTVETWVYITSNSPAEQFLYGKRANNAAYAPLLVGVSKSGTVYRSYYLGSFTGASWGLNSSFAKGTIDIPLNTWVHLAVVRNGSTFTSYVNGVADLTFTGLSSALMTNTDGVTIGADATSGSSPWFGYLDDLRITRAARYTANFTPPTAPFPTR